MLRTKESLNLVNLKTGKMNILIRRQNNAASFEKLVMIYDRAEESTRIVMSTKNGMIEEITIKNNFFTNLRELNA